MIGPVSSGVATSAAISGSGRSNATRMRSPELGITKAGDPLMRRLATQSAQYILGPFGQDSALRRWGLSLASRGAKNAKKRAVVAVARKLVVLMHRLSITQQSYDPMRGIRVAA